MHTFEAPIVGGTGADLPALLGLKLLTRHNAVLEMMPGREQLTFPGQGGYQIEWSPGTVHIPLTRAPSGHLVFECDNYECLKPAPAKSSAGLPSVSVVLASSLQVGPSDEAPDGKETFFDPEEIAVSGAKYADSAAAQPAFPYHAGQFSPSKPWRPGENSSSSINPGPKPSAGSASSSEGQSSKPRSRRPPTPPPSRSSRAANSGEFKARSASSK